MTTSGPNRNRFRLQFPHLRPKTEEEHFANNRVLMQAYPESLINLDVGAKVRYVGIDYSVNSGTFGTHAYNTAIEDEYDYWDGNQRLIVPRGMAGRYHIRANARLANNSATGAIVWIRYHPNNHATNFIPLEAPFATGIVFGAFSAFCVNVPYFLNDGDGVSSGVYHETGAARSFLGINQALNDIDPGAPTLELWRIGVRG